MSEELKHEEETSSQETLPVTRILANVVRDELAMICQDRAIVTEVENCVFRSSKFEIRSQVGQPLKVSDLIAAGDRLVYFNRSDPNFNYHVLICAEKKN